MHENKSSTKQLIQLRRGSHLGNTGFGKHVILLQLLMQKGDDDTLSLSMTPRVTAWDAMHASKLTNTNRLLRATHLSESRERGWQIKQHKR